LTDAAWLAELALTVLLPAAFLLTPGVRKSRGALLAVQALVVLGVITNRVTLAVPSLVAASNGRYFPDWMEFAITLALLTGGVIAFALAAKHLPVFGERCS
jgi:Ni/Fe-hydrogenase subunit HybB-like protein